MTVDWKNSSRTFQTLFLLSCNNAGKFFKQFFVPSVSSIDLCAGLKFACFDVPLGPFFESFEDLLESSDGIGFIVFKDKFIIIFSWSSGLWSWVWSSMVKFVIVKPTDVPTFFKTGNILWKFTFPVFGLNKNLFRIEMSVFMKNVKNFIANCLTWWSHNGKIDRYISI